MFFTDKQEHALISVYGDTDDQAIAKAINAFYPDRTLKILTPGDEKTLQEAGKNSTVIFIAIRSPSDKNLSLAKRLKDSRFVVADVIAFCLEDTSLSPIQILSHGFDACVDLKDSEMSEFKKFIDHKITSGNRRLNGLIQEEEYRRICDALSNAPASMMVFDQDKRTAFVSDHYFRAYPKIASRLTRGLSVYDAFAMMAKEEGVKPEDPIYERIQQFWYNLEGSVEFTLENGISYRLKAVQLPNSRGTVVMGQNISDYVDRKTEDS